MLVKIYTFSHILIKYSDQSVFKNVLFYDGMLYCTENHIYGFIIGIVTLSNACQIFDKELEFIQKAVYEANSRNQTDLFCLLY